MRILFDNGTPRGLAALLVEHTVEEARSQGWEELENGALIEAAERAGFDLVLTTDKNIRYQQNLSGRKIALVVLQHSQWPMVKRVAGNIVAAVNSASPGSYLEVEVPFTKQSVSFSRIPLVLLCYKRRLQQKGQHGNVRLKDRAINSLKVAMECGLCR